MIALANNHNISYRVLEDRWTNRSEKHKKNQIVREDTLHHIKIQTCKVKCGTVQHNVLPFAIHIRTVQKCTVQTDMRIIQTYAEVIINNPNPNSHIK